MRQGRSNPPPLLIATCVDEWSCLPHPAYSLTEPTVVARSGLPAPTSRPVWDGTRVLFWTGNSHIRVPAVGSRYGDASVCRSSGVVFDCGAGLSNRGRRTIAPGIGDRELCLSGPPGTEWTRRSDSDSGRRRCLCPFRARSPTDSNRPLLDTFRARTHAILYSTIEFINLLCAIRIFCCWLWRLYQSKRPTELYYIQL